MSTDPLDTADWLQVVTPPTTFRADDYDPTLSPAGIASLRDREHLEPPRERHVDRD